MGTGGAGASNGSAARAGILSIPRVGIITHSEAEPRDGLPVRLPRHQSPPPSSNVDRSARSSFVTMPHRWYTTPNCASHHHPTCAHGRTERHVRPVLFSVLGFDVQSYGVSKALA